MPRPAFSFFLFALLACGVVSSAAAAEKPQGKLSFNRDIRPILTNNCFACHGPDEKHREADLRLDVRDVAVELDALVPGEPDKSELISRITSADPEKQMPPPKAKKTLTAKEKELLRRWITEGAEYEGHWAFLPVENPLPPEVKNDAWAKNDIDRFVLAELERHGLAPSKEADRATLIRRLSIDLLGLPPAPEEVERFVKDDQPDAYERLVDRLLASSHYGERWGRHWLDQARYADSNGYTIDSERAMWPYRDWVIKATNDDMPFDQFTIEQLAGDLLPQPTKMHRIATAFHRNTMINEEGGTDAEQFRNEIVFDRVNTTGSVWLGLTVGCAQCHSHKFDPLSHREYYELFAFFNSSSDVNNRGETLEVLPGEILGLPASDAVDNKVAREAKQKLDKLNKEAAARQKAWEEKLSAGIEETKWTVMDLDRFDSAGGRKLKKLDDNSILAERDGPAKDTFELLVSAKLPHLAALKLVVMPHESLPSGGPGTAGNGNFVLSEFEVDVDGKPAEIKHALADHEKKGYPVLGAIDRDKKTGWALEMNQGGKGQHEAWFIFDDPLPMTTGKITVKLRHDVNEHYHIGRFTIVATNVAPQTHPDAKLWQQTLEIAKKPVAERSKSEAEQLTRVFRELDSEIAAAQRAADATAKKSAGAATLMVMRELPQPRTTFLLSRGDFLNPDKKLGPLTPNTPAWLPKFASAGTQPTRLDLAKWIVDKQNPLTPRVAVNRVWMEYFGAGLVESENDFGLQGTPPTHPELLDYLATQFMQQGWSRKALHRLIVTSATYRQSSKYRPELKDIDPDNKLLARQRRLRLDAEALRDTGLAACDLLDRSQGGPTVHPPQPEGVYAFTQNKKPWNSTPTNERYRRAMYTTFIRSAPYPLFTTFDAPSFSAVCTRRPRSNTPLQALTVANDEAFVEFSQALAARLWQDNSAAGDEADLARIRRAFVLCLARDPSARESDAVLKFLRQQQSTFAADSAAARAAAPANRPSQLSEADGAAWSAVARAIFNTDEFITRE